jgi:hypothetical protein
MHLFSSVNCGDASPAKRDQHDSLRLACLTYLGNEKTVAHILFPARFA